MADTKQHNETYNAVVADTDEIYFEKNISGTWTAFRTVLSNIKTWLQLYFQTIFPNKTIELDYDAALAIIDSTSDGQEYRIVGSVSNPLHGGVSYILTKGIFNGTNTFAEKVTVVLTDGTQIDGRYNLFTNTLVAFRKMNGTITQVDVDKPVISIFENTLGEVPVTVYHNVGDYDVNFSVVTYFSKGKTFVNFGNPSFDIYHIGSVLDAMYYSYEITSGSTIRIYSIDGSIFTQVNEGFKQTYFEIIHKI